MKSQVIMVVNLTITYVREANKMHTFS